MVVSGVTSTALAIGNGLLLGKAWRVTSPLHAVLKRALIANRLEVAKRVDCFMSVIPNCLKWVMR